MVSEVVEELLEDARRTATEYRLALELRKYHRSRIFERIYSPDTAMEDRLELIKLLRLTEIENVK